VKSEHAARISLLPSAKVEILCQIWEHQYALIDREVRVLDPKEMPEPARRIESPYKVEARYSTKRSMGWVCYKVHLMACCDEGLPHLITNVDTTAATATDVKKLTLIQQRLAANGMLLAFQVVDFTFVCGSNLVSSHARQIDLTGPAYKDNTRQAKADERFDVANFRIDLEKKMATLPLPLDDPG
jgi:transposase